MRNLFIRTLIHKSFTEQGKAHQNIHLCRIEKYARKGVVWKCLYRHVEKRTVNEDADQMITTIPACISAYHRSYRKEEIFRNKSHDYKQYTDQCIWKKY